MKAPVSLNSKRVGINSNPLAPTGAFNPHNPQAPRPGWARFPFIVPFSGKEEDESTLMTTFRAYDPYFYDLVQHGIKPMVVFTAQAYEGNRAWDTPSAGEPEWDDYAGGYGRRLTRFLERYGYASGAVQIENEPNLPQFHRPPHHYAKILGKATTAIDAHNARYKTSIIKVLAGLSPETDALAYLDDLAEAVPFSRALKSRSMPQGHRHPSMLMLLLITATAPMSQIISFLIQPGTGTDASLISLMALICTGFLS